VVAGTIRTTAADPFPVAYLIVPPAVLLAMALVARRGVVAAPARLPDDRPAAQTRLLTTPLVFLLSAVTLLATLSEGALETWSAIYLRLALDMPVAVGVLGVVAFHAAMGAGRLASGRVIWRFGRRATLAAAGLLVAIAMPATLAVSEPATTIVGLLFVALGLAVMFPIGISLAGDREWGGSGAVASAVIGVGYAGFLIGPALIGGIAELASLRVALLTVAVAGLVALWVAVIGLRGRSSSTPAGVS
jgi:predicted MFS family arabinose efflux permease